MNRFLSYLYFVILISFALEFTLIGYTRLFFSEIASFISTRDLESILTLTGRDNIWNSVFESLREYPFGTGYASDQYLLLDEYNLGILGEVSSAHSIYLESFIAAKYLGLGALIFSFIYLFRFSEKNFNQNLSRILQTLIFY